MDSDRRGLVPGSPLHRQIARRLDDLDADHGPCDDTTTCGYTAIAALRAVMDIHQAFETGCIERIDPDGTVEETAIETPDGDVVYLEPPEVRCACTGNGTLPDPCPTVTAVAHALGLEDPDA